MLKYFEISYTFDRDIISYPTYKKTMSIKEIIEFLRKRETDFLKTKSFSESPGIYAFFYIGDQFPLLGDLVSKHQIIYIGKTESSQERRDAKTHFTTGKTGSSTVRKSIGSILCTQENLTPIPRNDSDYAKGRFSHFKFDNESEIKITKWMENNLALSFYEYPKTKQEIEDLETEIIKELIPILNISKNKENPFRETLQQLRKNCASIAIKNSGFNEGKSIIKEKKITTIKNEEVVNNSLSGIAFIDNITKSDVKSRNIRIKVENKHLFPAEKQGYPSSYHLNFSVGDIEFVAEYKIGSKDGKSRSGILKLGDYVFQEILKIKIGTNLKISKLKSDKYRIERL